MPLPDAITIAVCTARNRARDAVSAVEHRIERTPEIDAVLALGAAVFELCRAIEHQERRHEKENEETT